MCVCVCVCVWEREREREWERFGLVWFGFMAVYIDKHMYIYKQDLALNNQQYQPLLVI